MEPKDNSLEERAREILAGQSGQKEPAVPRDWKALAEDLRIHQIELELQNEELRRNQLELQAQRDRYCELYDFSPVGYFTLDGQKRIREVNRHGASMLGSEPAHLIDRPFSRFIAAKSQDDFYLWFQRLKEEGLRQTCELWFKGPEEQLFCAVLDGATLANPEEKPVQFLLALTDITLAKKAREAIRRAKEDWERTFDAIDDLVIIVDEQLRIRRVNRAARLMMGEPAWDQSARTCYELLYGATQPCTGCPAAASSAERIPHRAEITPPRLGKTFLVTASEFDDPTAEARRIVCCAKDITGEKALERQLRQAQKMESIGTLAGGIAHDFNNILAIIMGNTELARADLPTGHPVRRNLGEILAASRRARDLVAQILDFSRKSPPVHEPVDLGPIVADALRLLRATIPSNIEIRSAIDAPLPTVAADPVRIRQVMINLATNAAHAMAENGGVLEVRLRHVDTIEPRAATPELAPGDYLEWTVSDSGCGIAPEHLERIFDPYFTTKQMGRGTGLGLAVVRGIINGYGGRITVTSTPGAGSTFHIHLPALKDQAAPSAPQAEVKPVPRGSERILVVDDEEMLTRLLHQQLERLGYRVVALNRPREALDIFRADPQGFDLLITDLTMPEMTGDRLAVACLETRPDLPILLCTGYSDRLDSVQARHLGIRASVRKPLDLETLAVTVRRLIDEPTP